MILSLIGMPGSGKSTVGRLLARQLEGDYIDSDVEIEHRARCSIQEFFAAHGEESFRDLEEQVIDELTEGNSGRWRVLATGGGAVLRAGNRERLRARTTVVYLRASPEDLLRRLRHDTQRPLLQTGDPARALRQLYAAREPLYRATCHYVVETGRPSVATLANMIVMQLELAGVLPHDRRC